MKKMRMKILCITIIMCFTLALTIQTVSASPMYYYNFPAYYPNNYGFENHAGGAIKAYTFGWTTASRASYYTIRVTHWHLEPTIYWSNIGLPLGIGVSYKASMSNLDVEFRYDTSASSSTYHYIDIIENGNWAYETLPAEVEITFTNSEDDAVKIFGLDIISIAAGKLGLPTGHVKTIAVELQKDVNFVDTGASASIRIIGNGRVYASFKPFWWVPEIWIDIGGWAMNLRSSTGAYIAPDLP